MKRFIYLVILFGITPLLGASDFVDTRVSFILSNDNILVGPGETNPSNPGTRFGSASSGNTFFYDNYETKYTGYESLSHLVLYKKMPSYFENLTTEASLALLVILLSEYSVGFGDSGSYLRLTYAFDKEENSRQNIQLTLFPYSSDRFRLGYSYQISWGGSDIFPKQDPDINKKNPVPGAKLQLNYNDFYAFTGAKSSLLQRKRDINDPTELESFWGFMGGAGWDNGFIRAEVNGGFFRRGLNPNNSVMGDPVDSLGLSIQLGLQRGLRIGKSIDFALYKNDPNEIVNFFKPEEYGTGLSWVISAEFTNIYTRLEDADRPGSTVYQRAVAGDINLKLKYNYTKFAIDAVYKDLAFILLNVPSLTPYQSFPKELRISPAIFYAVYLDHHLPSLHLTPGISFGMEWPAYFEDKTNTVTVVRSISNRNSLKTGDEIVPIVATKFYSKLDISEMLAMIFELRFQIDNNMTTFKQDINGEVIMDYTEPYLFGFNLVFQGRF
ncbi:MAG: hypothetical protein N2746_09790 [Deltaproteobacteria bacterium]|nr:hypothetical protein [Deltaproteobacteria bacterium]